MSSCIAQTGLARYPVMGRVHSWEFFKISKLDAPPGPGDKGKSKMVFSCSSTGKQRRRESKHLIPFHSFPFVFWIAQLTDDPLK